MLNRLEPFGAGPISEPVSLRGIESDFSTKNAACGSIARRLISGACDSVDGSCLFVCPVSHAGLDRSEPVDLQLHILDDVLKATNRKILPRDLHSLNVQRSPTDPVEVF